MLSWPHIDFRSEVSVYADDICIYHKNRSARFAHLAVQRHLNEIGRWANEWRININAEKTKAVVFSKRTRLQLPALKLHGEDIEYVPRCPYLGVILDRRMNWKPHVEVLRGKAHGSLTALSPLLRSSLPSRTKLLLYKTYIRPTMTYAAPAWAFITKSSMLRLQAVQNRALRLIGGYDRYTRNDFIHSDLQIVKLKSFMKHLALKLYGSAKRSRNKCICSLGTGTLIDSRKVPKPVHILDKIKGAQQCA